MSDAVRGSNPCAEILLLSPSSLPFPFLFSSSPHFPLFLSFFSADPNACADIFLFLWGWVLLGGWVWLGFVDVGFVVVLGFCWGFILGGWVLLCEGLVFGFGFFSSLEKFFQKKSGIFFPTTSLMIYSRKATTFSLLTISFVLGKPEINSLFFSNLLKKVKNQKSKTKFKDKNRIKLKKLKKKKTS